MAKEVIILVRDESGKLVEVASSNPLPISGKIEVTAGGVPVILSRDDVDIASKGDVTITNEDNMFDRNYETYATVEMGASGEISIALKRPMALNGIIFVQDPADAWSSNEFTYWVNYTDGSKDTGTISSITDGGSFIPTDPTKRVICFGVKAPSTLETTVSSDIYEIQAFVIVEAAPVGLKDTSGTQINPPTKEIQQEIRNQLSLPNEDVNIQTSPSANTSYSAKIDAGRADKVVVSLYSDQVPSSVKIEGSNDDTNYYELDGISVDLSNWKTDRYNILELEPYTRYVKATLTTPDTAPNRVEVYIKGVRA